MVGGDFGSTVGTAKVHLLNPSHGYITCRGDSERKTECFNLVRKIKKCNQLTYAIHSKNSSVLVLLTAVKTNPIRSPSPKYQEAIKTAIKRYTSEGVIEDILMFTPVFINITLKHCPLGFNFTHNTSTCSCYPNMQQKQEGLKCLLRNDGGYLSRPQNVWIGVTSHKEVILSRVTFCPLCNRNRKLPEQQVNLESVTSIILMLSVISTAQIDYVEAVKEGTVWLLDRHAALCVQITIT